MKQSIPTPLQTQILVYSAMAAASLIAGAAILVYLSREAACPLLAFSVVTAFIAGRIYYAAASGRCIILTGTVLKVERSAILRRPNAVLAEIDGKALRVALHSRIKVPGEGDRIAFYVLDSTPVYEWRGIHQLSSYLALSEGEASHG